MSGGSQWACTSCTFENSSARSVCEICNTKRPSPAKSTSAGSIGGSQASEGTDGKQVAAGGQAIRRIPEFYGLPAASILGSYGGGDDMRTSNQLCVINLPAAALPSELKDRILKEVPKTLAINAAIPKSQRIAHLPEACPDLKSAEWHVRFQVSSRVFDAETMNVFCQGFIFEDVAASSERQGAIKYPLVGLFDSSGFLEGDTREPATIGMNSLRWADSHIHKVELLDAYGTPISAESPWHFGSDMARFALDPSVDCAHAWAAVVDAGDGKDRSHRVRCEATCLLVVSPELEDKVERALRAVPRSKATDEMDTGKLAEALLGCLGSALSKPAQAAVRAALTATASGAASASTAAAGTERKGEGGSDSKEEGKSAVAGSGSAGVGASSASGSAPESAVGTASSGAATGSGTGAGKT